jgi:hypothetical protein
MLIAGVLCLCAAVAAVAFGVRALLRPRPADVNAAVLRAVAPTQLAAAVMLAAGGLVALVADARTGLLVVIVCILGAIGTVAAGSWQGVRFAAAHQDAAAPAADCAGSCAACTLSCR